MHLLRNLIALIIILAFANPVDANAQSHSLSLIGNSNQFVELTPKRLARNTAFYDAQNQETNLGNYRGKVVLINFWASWCVPCIAEMPSLNQLAQDTLNSDLAIIPISIDADGLLAAIPFYHRHRLNHLGLFVDPTGKTAYSNQENHQNAEFALYGLPITYAIDREGRVLGYITGMVDWQSSDASLFIDRLLQHQK